MTGELVPFLAGPTASLAAFQPARGDQGPARARFHGERQPGGRKFGGFYEESATELPRTSAVSRSTI
ncbi:MAG: hypothetical protein JO150_01090 [Acidobacteriaceae bacterium]|nr:hypothetical protein [Acidobacteriaceae bacterium]